jgi:anti-sigma B factor antagonist
MTPYQLEPRETGDPKELVVNIGGELDLTNARELEERLEALTSSTGACLVLDLTRVLFIDSAALHVLFRLARRLGRERFGLVLEPTSPLARTLSIVAISDVATVGTSVDGIFATPVLD